MTTLDDLKAGLAGLISAQQQRILDDQQGLTGLQSALVLAGKLDPLPPSTPVIPPDSNTITISGRSFPLAAVDPTALSNPAGADFPGFRGADQLVAYTRAGSRTGTNQYGSEATVVSGVLGPLTIGGAAGGLTVPVGGYVLSGHGAGSDFLRASVPGAAVAASHVTGPVVPPRPAGMKSLGVYLMDGVGKLVQMPPKCNRILVAFYQGTDLVEWGGDSPSKTASDLSAWRASRAGNQVLISLGGQGGTVNLGSVPAGIARINGHLPVDGIDFDAESFSYSPSQAVSICKDAAAAIGRAPKDFVVSFVPPGGDPVTPALGAAHDVKAAGFTVNFGQQLYETSISDSDVINATQRAVSILGAASVTIGMMLGDSHNSWTVDSAESRMRQVVQRWPDIAGAYLWESSRAGTAEWASRVGTVLGL